MKFVIINDLQWDQEEHWFEEDTHMKDFGAADRIAYIRQFIGEWEEQEKSLEWPDDYSYASYVAG